MKKVTISLCGCDDITSIDMEVTEEELEFLHRLSKRSHEVSEYACMPTMEIYER